LPATGDDGDAPEFPLPAPSVEVLALWLDLWRTPQAVAWRALGWTRVVARYTLLLLEAEKPDTVVALLSEVRQLEDRLGLTPMAMKRLQWEIAEVPAGDEEVAGVASLDEYRSRTG
jgi:hypothetical protein